MIYTPLGRVLGAHASYPSSVLCLTGPRLGKFDRMLRGATYLL